MSSRPATARHGIIRAYYLATPVFWVLDAAFGVHVRVAFLDDFTLGRNVYYACCCAIGVASLRSPRYAGVLAFVESCANIILIVVSVGAWYLKALDQVAGPGTTVDAPSSAQLAGFVLAAVMAIVSYELRLPSAAQEMSGRSRDG